MKATYAEGRYNYTNYLNLMLCFFQIGFIYIINWIASRRFAVILPYENNNQATTFLKQILFYSHRKENDFISEPTLLSFLTNCIPWPG